MPAGIVCAPTPEIAAFSSSAGENVEEFDETGARVIKGNCVYNVEAVAASLPGDLVLLVNGEEVTISADSAGETAFNIPRSSFKAGEQSVWLPGSGVDRPQAVTDKWSKIEKRSIVDDIASIKNVKARDFSYTISVKDADSPCSVQDGEAVVATQYHSEVSVKGDHQLVTPAQMEWLLESRKTLVINCGGTTAGVLTADATKLSFDNDGHSELVVKLTNTGGSSATLGNLAGADLGLAAPFSKLSKSTCTAGAEIAPSASCTLAIAFNPSTAGDSTDSLAVSYSADGETKTVAVEIAGKAVDMKIDPTTHDFGQVTANNPSSMRQFSIKNLSSGPVTLGSFVTSADLGLATPFQYQNGDTNLCYGGKTLASGASCTIKVGANSVVAGTFSDALVMPYKNSADEDGTVSATVTVKYVN